MGRGGTAMQRLARLLHSESVNGCLSLYMSVEPCTGGLSKCTPPPNQLSAEIGSAEPREDKH